MHFIFLSTQLYREVPAWRIETEGRIGESYTFLLSVSYFHHFFFNLVSQKASDSHKQDVRIHYTRHGAKSLVNINAPKFRVDNDKEHVYIKLVVDSLFV